MSSATALARLLLGYVLESNPPIRLQGHKANIGGGIPAYGQSSLYLAQAGKRPLSSAAA